MFDTLKQALGFTTTQTPPPVVEQPESVAAEPEFLTMDEQLRLLDEDKTLSRYGRKVPTREAQSLRLWCTYRMAGNASEARMAQRGCRPALKMLLRQAGPGYLDRLCRLSATKGRRGLQDFVDGLTDENGRLWSDGARWEPWERLGICTSEESRAFDSSPLKVWGPGLLD